MISKAKMTESIKEIYNLYIERNVIHSFTLESIGHIFEIGNEVFQKNNPDELDRLKNKPQTQAPDIMDDEPFSLTRTLQIYEDLGNHYLQISPELIQKVFELNSKLAWKTYREKYNEYISKISEEYPGDEYINYLQAIVYYDQHHFDDALHAINKAISNNPSSANYTHIKSLCLMQRGDFETARTYLYQSLFLVELKQHVSPRLKNKSDIYPNYPIEFHTSADLIRSDLQKLDRMEKVFSNQLLPLFD